MSSTFSTIRTAVQTASQTVAPFSATTTQVVLGNYNWGPGTNFFANILTTGPWLFILPCSGEADGQQFNGEFDFFVDLVYGFANNANYDFTAIEDIQALLIQAWVRYSKFVSGLSLGPLRISWSEPEVRSDISPVVARTRFVLTGTFVAG